MVIDFYVLLFQITIKEPPLTRGDPVIPMDLLVAVRLRGIGAPI